MSLHSLMLVPTWLVLVAAFTLPALESSTLIGVLVPGETALLLGGVLAHFGRAPIVAVMAVGVLGAVAGDSVGYSLGRRLGPALERRVPLLDRGRDRASALLRRYGAPAVLFGRWIAVVRAVIPAVAGWSGVSYPTFALFNAIGGVLWGVTVAGSGYLLGAAYTRAERSLGVVGGTLLAAAAVMLVLTCLRAHRAARRP